jgi:hypothetical protein
LIAVNALATTLEFESGSDLRQRCIEWGGGQPFLEVGTSLFGPSLTVSIDDRIDIEVEAIGRTTFLACQTGTDNLAQEQGAPLSMHRHRRKRRDSPAPSQPGDSSGRALSG